MTSAPYPADTRAKGWRFEIDVERIEQSDTWTLAPSAIRPWLLMLWMTAWKQTPCGTLTNDDTLIAARIGMTPKDFAKHRAILMRGWWLADDGRLYHAALTERVEAMLVKREKDAGRTAARRARAAGVIASPPVVTRDTHATHEAVTGEFDTKHQAPSTSNQAPEEKTSRAPRSASPAIARPDDVSEQTWADFNALRKAKKAPITETVLAGARRESALAVLSLEQFLKVWCERGSQGLEASWLKPNERGSAAPINGKHSGFASKNYREGINDDGSLT